MAAATLILVAVTSHRRTPGRRRRRAPAPPRRVTVQTAVWTGTEMIVWVESTLGAPDTGGRYDPSTIHLDCDFNRARTTPAGRYRAHGGVERHGDDRLGWVSAGRPLNTGGRYDPSTDAWTATSTGAGVPAGRSHPHGGVDRHGDDRLGWASSTRARTRAAATIRRPTRGRRHPGRSSAPAARLSTRRSGPGRR